MTWSGFCHLVYSEAIYTWYRWTVPNWAELTHINSLFPSFDTPSVQRWLNRISSLKFFVIFIFSRDVGKAALLGWRLDLSLSCDPFLGGVAMETDGVWLSLLGSAGSSYNPRTAHMIQSEQHWAGPQGFLAIVFTFLSILEQSTAFLTPQFCHRYKMSLPAQLHGGRGTTTPGYCLE